VAMLSPVFTILMTSLNAGSLIFNWKVIGAVALGSGLSYITKNFFTPAQIVITDANKSTVEAVKNGEASVFVKQI